jgi:hypothetical protein
MYDELVMKGARAAGDLLALPSPEREDDGIALSAAYAKRPAVTSRVEAHAQTNRI